MRGLPPQREVLISQPNSLSPYQVRKMKSENPTGNELVAQEVFAKLPITTITSKLTEFLQTDFRIWYEKNWLVTLPTVIQITEECAGSDPQTTRTNLFRYLQDKLILEDFLKWYLGGVTAFNKAYFEMARAISCNF